ncbi:hypothetical protein ISG33_06615 [Glaciecola sp. MH2013]|uniref:hypothetical protein n=1 Tax=Glaciecola sp. MH2013 TaxID=2785524 RepID=UPI00189CA64F|nr:hypothetical protein [Glaciecola sp. MH2013]MBF7073069.1 hypothetical protein [Glaciecola sp. MH2013]
MQNFPTLFFTADLAYTSSMKKNMFVYFVAIVLLLAQVGQGFAVAANTLTAQPACNMNDADMTMMMQSSDMRDAEGDNENDVLETDDNSNTNESHCCEMNAELSNELGKEPSKCKNDCNECGCAHFASANFMLFAKSPSLTTNIIRSKVIRFLGLQPSAAFSNKNHRPPIS